VAARLIALAVLTGAAVVVAILLQRRRPDPPSAPSYRAPTQLDPRDFPGAEGLVLVALFSSLTCHSCPRAWETIEAVLGPGPAPGVTWRRIDVQSEPELHRRYKIDGVPMTVVADTEGVVLQAFFGPLSSEQLVEALAVAGISR
jgi:hypothetical protein